VLEPLLPAGRKPGRPPKWARRRLIDGIRWRTRTGSPWRDVPPCYGPWQSVYGLFRRWQRDGTWPKIVTALQALADAASHVAWDVSVDSGTARAHQHAAGARRNGAAQAGAPGGDGDREPDDHALGRSRGGLTSKFHLACEQGQKPLAIIVTAGQRGDSPQFQPVLEAIRVPRPGGGRPRTRPGRVLADKPTDRARTGSTCAAAASAAPSPKKPTRSPTGRRKAAQAAGARPSTPNGTSSVTPWNAASTGSSETAPPRPGTTSSPSATRPPSTSPPSANGSGPSLLKHALVDVGYSNQNATSKHASTAKDADNRAW
jgi:transposase